MKAEDRTNTCKITETYDELAPKESMNLRCEEIVKDMAKFAHAKIKKAQEELDGAMLDSERKVSMIKSIYKSSLHKVLQQVLAKDRGDDLWGYYNQINKTWRLQGTSVAVERLKKQQVEWL
ncbi:hypothetical protein VF21_10661 [Pseudogymnoascus sp. 05NY08]|nr:hypothetical protein VF21_10661 [Pseudogymnoascus sp. 05NY08]